MQRYFITEENWKENEVIIDGDDVHHISRVMRFKSGDEVICIHPTGKTAICKLTKITPTQVHLNIIEQQVVDYELPIHVTIAQSLPKSNKLDFILQKGTELGARKFILFQSERSITKWNEKKDGQKIKRYEKIVKQASEQSYRNFIPEIVVEKKLMTILQEKEKYDKIIFAYEDEAKTDQFQSISTILNELSDGEKLLIFIGPEGGFAKTEVEQLLSHQCSAVRLGKRILRTETASLYALSAISYHFEELNRK